MLQLGVTMDFSIFLLHRFEEEKERGFEDEEAMVPVSYTHLDVYKRQRQYDKVRRKASPKEHFPPHRFL